MMTFLNREEYSRDPLKGRRYPARRGIAQGTAISFCSHPNYLVGYRLFARLGDYSGWHGAAVDCNDRSDHPVGTGDVGSLRVDQYFGQSLPDYPDSRAVIYVPYRHHIVSRQAWTIIRPCGRLLC